jgi:type IV pilus assembly protein PilY1
MKIGGLIQMKKIILIAFFIVLFTGAAQLYADDTDLFMVAVPSDVLIILDMSGSMNYPPAGGVYVSPPNRRIDIARSVLFDLLDDNEDGKIDAKDEPGLNMRLGYMRYWNAFNNDDGEPLTGSIKVLSPIGTAYKDVWAKISDKAEDTPVGGTPLAAALAEAKTHFLRDVNPVDPSIACRKKFVILVTDGTDTYGCGGNGVDPNSCSDETFNPGMYRRRMQTVQKAKELAEAGIKVFVVGFGGSAPECLKTTLNWAARYGGTDNPTEGNSGDSKAYDITKFGNPCTTTDTNADPALYPLSGYAFLAEDATQLSKAIKAIAKYIQEKSYSFTAPTIPLVRILDKDVGYISSFIPDETPFWRGNLKAYRLNSDGTFPVDADGNPLNASLLWDAVVQLKKTPSDSRRIYTYVNSALKEFVYGNLTNADLDVPSDAERQNLINHIRGIDAYDIDLDSNTTEERDWKLGDIFHSNAVIVGSPNQYFEDTGFSGPGQFYDTYKNRTKVVIVGGNDGMLHAFNATTGAEQWAFIPPSVLKTLKLMPTAHNYYVDSSPKVSDVWIYSSVGDKTKTKDEWKTTLICGLRKGGKQYFALDITDTLNPIFLWEFPRSNDAATLAKVGQSWSEPAIGRVKVEHDLGFGSDLYERWVAFIGGGFDFTETKTVKATIGRAFFVIDIKTGDIIWEYSRDDSVTYSVDDQRRYMTYSFAAPPFAVDTNSDGYVDKVYIGDMGGQMWAFNVSSDEINKKSNSLWSAKRLTQPPSSTSEKHPIYYQAAVAFDDNRVPWVYYGTGDRENPTDTTNPAEFFYGIMDDGLAAYPRRENQELQEISSINTFTPYPSKKGWYLILEHSAQLVEKVLAKPAVFDNIVYFTTYAYKGKATGCSVEGDARLYELYYKTGGGALNVDELSDLSGTPSSERYTTIGTGVPSNPVISVNSKGQASIIIGTTSGQVFSDEAFSSGTGKSLLYWREVTR